MQILRGVKVSTKLTAFLLLALGTASSLAIIHPQPVNAEGYLFGKVRCAVRTVFNRECEKKVPPAAEEPRQNTPTPNGSGATTPQQQNGVSTNKQRTATNGGEAAPLEPIEIPQELLTEYGDLELPTVGTTTNVGRVGEPARATHFNALSPYAVAGAHTAAAINEAPVQRSAEGWKLFGIAWYWWAIAGLAIAVMVVSGRSILNARAVSKI